MFADGGMSGFRASGAQVIIHGNDNIFGAGLVICG